MPNKNGLEVVKEVKEFYAQKAAELSELKIEKPRFIILTAFKTLQLTKQAAKEGITEIFEKPIN